MWVITFRVTPLWGPTGHGQLPVQVRGPRLCMRRPHLAAGESNLEHPRTLWVEIAVIVV